MRGWSARTAPVTPGRETQNPKSKTRPKAGLHIRRETRADAPPPRLLTILDQKADLAVDAKHRDLIVFDETSAFLIQNELMPRKVFDASRMASRQASSNPFGDCAMTSIFRTIAIGLSSHCIFARAKHERKETRPASLGFALDESDRENIGRARDAHDEGC